MTINIKSLLLACFCFLTLSLSVSASIITDNFDSYSTGFIQSVGSANWFRHDSSNALRVLSGSPFSSPNYLGYGTGVYNKADLNSYSNLWVGYKFKATTYPSFGYLPIPILNYNLDGTASTGRSALFRIWQEYGNFYVYGRSSCESAFGQQEQITGITTSDDLQIWFYLDLTNKQYKVYVNNWSSNFYPFIQTNDCVTTTDHARLIGFESFSNTNYRVDDFEVISTSPFEIDGVCGSDNGLTLSSLPSNLCTSGTASAINSDYDSSPRFWRWWCNGSGGGTNELCLAYMSTQYDTPSLIAQCGYKNGTVTTSLPTYTDACFNGTITNMTQVNDHWTWSCVVSESDTMSCSTIEPPTIPATLPEEDNDIECSGFSLTSFDGFGTCISSIGKWLFLPSQSTLNQFYNLKDSLRDKIPFAYFYATSDLIKGLSVQNVDNLVWTVYIKDDIPVTLLDVNAFKTFMGSNMTTYFSFLRGALWIIFLFGIYNQIKNIFSNQNDN